LQVTLTQADGLHVNARVTLTQLATDGPLTTFADGLLAVALTATNTPEQTLAAALCRVNARYSPLLAALLALDAEVVAMIDDERRVFPLPGFLTYRTRLPLDRFPPSTLRLPPLNPGGRYHFVTSDEAGCAVVRADVHPELRVAGHVRIVLSDQADLPPRRLLNLEHRLERQVLNAALLDAALNEAGDPAITPAQRHHLADTLRLLLK
jgi:CO/xanthine dehydrogenase FAD-binding subunit